MSLFLPVSKMFAVKDLTPLEEVGDFQEKEWV